MNIFGTNPALVILSTQDLVDAIVAYVKATHPELNWGATAEVHGAPTKVYLTVGLPPAAEATIINVTT